MSNILFKSICSLFLSNLMIQLKWMVIYMKSIITINLQDKEDYTSVYNNQRLCPELLSYILEEQKGIPLNHNIEFEIKSNNKLSENEKNDFIDILRSNLGQDIKESYLHKKFIQIRACFLFIIGTLFILFSFFMSKQATTIFSEFSLIIGWVGIWEATYILLFDNVQTKIKIKKYKKLVGAKVIFHED